MQKTVMGACGAIPQWLVPDCTRRKILLVVKLVIVLLISMTLGARASVLSQTVSLSGKKLQLKEVFGAIRSQTGYTIFGNAEILRNSHAVSVDVNKMPLIDFLNLILKDQPLTYRIDGKNIVLSNKTKDNTTGRASADPLGLEALAAEPIKGVVKDSDGNPISGASVTIKGTSKGTTTNAKGEFTVEAVENVVLVI